MLWLQAHAPERAAAVPPALRQGGQALLLAEPPQRWGALLMRKFLVSS